MHRLLMNIQLDFGIFSWEFVPWNLIISLHYVTYCCIKQQGYLINILIKICRCTISKKKTIAASGKRYIFMKTQLPQLGSLIFFHYVTFPLYTTVILNHLRWISNFSRTVKKSSRHDSV